MGPVLLFNPIAKTTDLAFQLKKTFKSAKNNTTTAAKANLAPWRMGRYPYATVIETTSGQKQKTLHCNKRNPLPVVTETNLMQQEKQFN